MSSCSLGYFRHYTEVSFSHNKTGRANKARYNINTTSPRWLQRHSETVKDLHLQSAIIAISMSQIAFILV